MTGLLSLTQEHAGQAVEAVAHGAESSGAGQVDLGTMIMHHLVDLNEYELPGLGPIHLPTGWTVNLGPLGVVDFAPTKHVLLMAFAACLCLVIFISVARSVRARADG
ncbi:MAG: hypothetical protein PVI57_05015, partial [Gemmatimonadota bacterium]